MALVRNKTKPCVECPFTRDGGSGCITSVKLLGVINSGSAGSWPCHMENGPPREACVGAVLFAQNVRARGISSIENMPPANARVFTTVSEFATTYDARPCPTHGIPAGRVHNSFARGIKS